jgi:hypothetical protein
MSSKETQHLAQLLSQFDVTSLGEGDTNAGANVLAAMAITLANLAPDDGTVIHPDGTPARFGTSLLISGSGSCGRVGDEIITEVERRQANLATRLRSYCNAMEERAGKPSLINPPTGPGADTADELLATALSDIEPLYGTTTQAWGRIMEESPAEQVRDLADKPKFLVCAARPKDLEAQLVGLRPGHPLIHLGINRPADFAELADPGISLVGGHYPIGDGCELVRGNMIISDPLRLLNEAAKAPDERTAWLGHFLWLTDSEAGPDVPEDVTLANAGSGAITECFRVALGNVMARRLSPRKGKPLRLCHDTRAAAHRWTDFLREMEQRLPGIYGAGRNLLNTLVFGLGELARVGKGLRFTLKGVEEFARFLVRRAVNARTAICLAADVARRQSQIERIFRKLQEGWLNERKIYGNLCIPAADCRECLLWLQESGLALRKDSKWGLLEGAQLNFNDCRLPLLEV